MLNAQSLAQFPLFASLLPADIEPLLPHLKERRFRRGQVLFVEGELGAQVYFIISGQVKLGNVLPDGEEQISDWCGPGDSIGEFVLLEPSPYPATAEVVQESTMLVLHNGDMPHILATYPQLALSLIRVLSKRLRFTQEFVRILTSRSTAGILAALLLRLARPATRQGQPIYVDGGLTHRDLAAMIGTSRECVNRSLNNWKRAGIIAAREDKIEILKPHELADWP